MTKKQSGIKKKEADKNRIQYLIESSLIDVLMLTPKPGLMDDYKSSGPDGSSMKDYLSGIRLIAPCLTELFFKGYSWTEEPEAMYPELHQLALKAAEEIIGANEGKNIRRGTVFTMGIICAAAGYDLAMRGENHVKSILSLARRITEKPMEDYYHEIETERPRTYGEMVYHKYGIGGIRTEAAAGFPIIRKVSYPAMAEYRRKYPDPEQNSAILINVLLHIMTALEDSDVISQSDPGGLHWVQNRARYILALGGAFTREGMDELWDWDEDCANIHISPVGSVDVLTATLFLWRLTGRIFEL